MESPAKDRLDFKSVTQAAVARIESHYGLDVVWRLLPEGVTGDLDGTDIVLDSANDAETELYVLLHLFGHTAQWNTDARLRELGHRRPKHATPELMAEIQKYEMNASRIGISLLREIGHGEAQEWVSRFFWADWKFLETLYTTGEKIDMVVDWTEPIQILEPMPIPQFTPGRYENRQAFD